MKSLTVLLLLLAGLFISSCSNELDLTAEYEEVTVVYGVFDTANTTQYIRVMKGFLDPETNALEQAQNPDSIYYPANLIVRITERESNVTTELRRVVGDTLNPPIEKPEGVFASSPNILYAYRREVKKGNNYDLYIENPNSGKIIKSSTPVLGPYSITYPPSFIDQFKIPFYTNSRGLEISWNSPRYGKTYDVQIGFNYLEWGINENKSDAVEKTVRYTTAIGLTSNTTNGGESMAYNLEGDAFFSRLSGLISEDASVNRAATNTPFDIRINAGEEELYRYILVNNTLANDITQLNAKPEYTNIENGIGLFSSKASVVRNGIMLSQSSLDSLSCGQFTRNLNFEGACN
ncbi:MAG: DUF4249 family protein [Chitinophagales bacterium]